jgi:hypothetical protein
VILDVPIVIVYKVCNGRAFVCTMKNCNHRVFLHNEVCNVSASVCNAKVQYRVFQCNEVCHCNALLCNDEVQ